MSDGFFKRSSVGAIAVAAADPNVVYAGMGEACIRANVSHGDGVYRSDDGGDTWRHLGLAATRHIARVRIHPDDPDVVYVAAFGHAWGPNPERGVFRSCDGGRTWERVLFVDEHTGACDLIVDPTNPRVLYAALWQAQRTPYSLDSGGPGSGLFKSTDGGDSWARLDGNPGLPRGIKGRIGVTVSPARPHRVWATIEAHEGGIFRSDDGGRTWLCLGESHEQMQRPWYFMHVFADPVDPETMYVLNLNTWKSTDGGRTFARLPLPHGDDHDLWIDPHDPRRMIHGNDGGASVSFDGGETWSTQYNQPTAQLYHVTTDTRFPYRIYGSQQDNTTVSLPSRSDRGVISRLDFYPVGGHESGYIAINPENPDIAFGGALSDRITRYDHRTKQAQDVTVWPEDAIGWAAKDLKYRFSWTFPVVFSPHDSHVLYAAGNHVFRTTDEGHSWEVISPDLTRNDLSKQQRSGGPITSDNYTTEHYCTIFTLAESPLQPGLIWAGSDDGLIHFTQDGGKTWQQVTPPELPDWTWISLIEPSPHDPATAYVAATRYKLDDFRPYLLVTRDYGQTWQLITDGIRDEDFTRVIRADPARQGVLYAGTETGVYVSLDDGASWQAFQQNLPVCPIYDLAVKDGDLVAATHGRSFWILDDLTPLHQWIDPAHPQPVTLFRPRPTYRFHQAAETVPDDLPNRKTFVTAMGELVASGYVRVTPDGTKRLELIDAGKNPAAGVVVTYHLGAAPQGELTLTFRDAEGQVITRFSSEHVAGAGARQPVLSKQVGLNRFVWDMRYPEALPLAEGRLFNYWDWSGVAMGPLVPPGMYTVELAVDGYQEHATVEIVKDPRVPTSNEDLARQTAFLLQIRDKLSEVHRVVNEARQIRRQLTDWLTRTQGASINAALQELNDQLTTILAHLVEERVQVGDDIAVYGPQINSKLLALARFVESADTLPTTQSYAVFADLSARADPHIQRFQEIVTKELPAIEAQVRQANIPLIAVATQPRG